MPVVPRRDPEVRVQEPNVQTVDDTVIETVDESIQASRELAVRIADVITDTPASNTTVIDIHELTTIADFFVICSGENERQVRAITRICLDELGAKGIDPVRVEGEAVSGWILMDFRDVIVHIFDADLREFYNIEERWSDAKVILSIQ